MDIEAAIDLVSAWLDAVQVESASHRVDEPQARYRARDARGEPGANSTWPLAIHEAAHAVVATRGGLRVSYARLRADGSGAVNYEATPTSVNEMVSRVMADLAGVFAELLRDPHPLRRQQLATSCDVLVARLNADLCRGLVPTWELSHRCFAVLGACAVASSWQDITRVSRALDTSGSLSSTRIAALCWAGPRCAL